MSIAMASRSAKRSMMCAGYLSLRMNLPYQPASLLGLLKLAPSGPGTRAASPYRKASGKVLSVAALTCTFGLPFSARLLRAGQNRHLHFYGRSPQHRDKWPWEHSRRASERHESLLAARCFALRSGLTFGDLRLLRPCGHPRFIAWFSFSRPILTFALQVILTPPSTLRP